MSDSIPDAEEEVLTDLAHKLVDQVALYGFARDVAHNDKVIAAIQLAKQARAELLQDINAKIWLRGIPAINQGTKLGTAQKAFLGLRAVVGKDDIAAIEAVERGEDYLRDRIAKAVDDDRLTAHTRNYLQTLVTRVERTHEDIKNVMLSIQRDTTPAKGSSPRP
jgi:uncharacterized protein (TIGR02284 family)